MTIVINQGVIGDDVLFNVFFLNEFQKLNHEVIRSISLFGNVYYFVNDNHIEVESSHVKFFEEFNDVSS